MQRKKKPVEFHFVDMNDPERYKKLKVARACDFCRRRKSKCDIGVPGSGTCSNCQKYKMVCIFSPVTTRTTDLTPRPDDPLLTPQLSLTLMDQLQFKFSLLLIKDGQVGYEKTPYQPQPQEQSQVELTVSNEPSLQLETTLFNLYFNHVHPAFPILLKQSILHIHSQDRLLLSRALRFAIMTLACHFYFNTSTPIPDLQDLSLSNTQKIIQYFYQIAKHEIKFASSSPRLDTVQSLILLYKHHEILGTDGIQYLETAQELIAQLHSIVPQQQEMINRTRWILFSVIGLSNLSDKHFNRMYSHIDLPTDLPQPLQDEDPTSINQFAQISNLSVLYSHTVQSLIINSTSQLICFQQFKEIRQHWHDSLHPVTQTRLTSSLPDKDNIDILILYTAILYDMLYLLLILHHHLSDDCVETAYKLHRMVNTWVSKPSFISAFQSRRMASFALMLCLQIQFTRDQDQIDTDFIDRIRQTLARISIDPRLDNELKELFILVTNKTSSGYFSIQPVDYFSIPQPPPTDYFSIPHRQQPVDYFSIPHRQQQAVDYFNLVPPPRMYSTTSSSQDHISASTPGLWDMLSTTTNGGLTTPIREEENPQTSAWVQRQQLYIPSSTIEHLNQMKI